MYRTMIVSCRRATILCTGFVRGIAVNGVVRGEILLASGQMIDRPGLPEVIRENICFFRINKN
ncbi:hypothetical protein ANCDUO_22989 [Ancylostoma duodenale]|uniref:Uncharacterized protein n=1 Tax=Ancylostoma duodenale TaxID=51022 RepID=A0A0C2FJM5_9BILA|nr:hypothetical protein ANCDUO_22989 [Ancylostoma duodenale]